MVRLILLVVAGGFLSTAAKAQEHWYPLPGAASAFHVDVRSLALERGILRARVQTSDLGVVVLVEDVEVRCEREQIRTIARLSYDSDTGRRVPSQPDSQQPDTLWIAYPRGSEGHSLLSGLCQLGRDRKLLGRANAPTSS